MMVQAMMVLSAALEQVVLFPKRQCVHRPSISSPLTPQQQQYCLLHQGVASAHVTPASFCCWCHMCLWLNTSAVLAIMLHALQALTGVLTTTLLLRQGSVHRACMA